MKAKQIAAALLTGVFVNLFGRLFAGAKSAEKEPESYDSGFFNVVCFTIAAACQTSR